VGPAGFQGGSLPWREMLQTSSAKIAGLFARDLISYKNLCSLELPPSVAIGLGNDPAFHLKDSQWIAELRDAGLSEYILAVFRGDCESVIAAPAANRLLKIWPLRSLFFRYQHRTQMRFNQDRLITVMKKAGSNLPLVEQDASLMSFEKFVECINRAGQVHTDRLHCMILASLLGKEVYAYSTAYGKLEGVYEQSMKAWAKVNFVSQSPRM
jgi:exopolysaccharide biosynthesis predicted pyruvyltransferase EpsI